MKKILYRFTGNTSNSTVCAMGVTKATEQKVLSQILYYLFLAAIIITVVSLNVTINKLTGVTIPWREKKLKNKEEYLN